MQIKKIEVWGPCRNCHEQTNLVIAAAGVPEYLCAKCGDTIRKTDATLQRQLRRPGRGTDAKKT